MFKKVLFAIHCFIPFLFILCFPVSAQEPTSSMNTEKFVSLGASVSSSSADTKAYEETYHNLLNSILSVKDTASFPSKSISYKNVDAILNEVLTDHPEIFYFKHEGTKFYSDGKVELKYKYPAKKIKGMIKGQETKINTILKQISKPNDSDFDKVKSIHDYIVLNTAYDLNNYKRGTVPEASYTPYGLLMNGIAVCEGYSKTMQLLLEKVGIETHYITGKANGGAHAWNLVKIDGEYFYVDATWNDPAPNRIGEISYKYFLVPASLLKQDHSWNEQQFPAAKSNKFAYFQEFSSVKESGSYYYYSNSKDNHKLYRMKKDGSGKTKLLNVSAPYFALTKNSIYLSNYSNSGYLHQANLDGSQLKQLNKIHSIDLYIEKDKLFYTNKATGAKGSMKVS